MALLGNRVKSYNQIYYILKLIILSCKRFFSIILILISLFLTYSSSNIISEIALDTYGKVLAVSNSFYQVIADNAKSLYSMYGYFYDLKEENAKLKLEIERLRDVEELYHLSVDENNDLKTLLNFVENLEINSVMTARVIANNISPFASILILDAGYVNGIKKDAVVRNKYGLIGRIVKVGKYYSTVMSIDDFNSRIPVITDVSKEKGILAKHNDTMKIIYTRNDHDIKAGEKIYTSGEGKIYNSRLKVGEVVAVNNEGIFVKPYADIHNIEFVIIENLSK